MDFIITLTEGADTYNNTMSDATIAALGGVDRVTNSGANVSLDAGAGNDYIHNGNGGVDTTLLGGDGADTISNYGVGGVKIAGGAGDDTINVGNNANNSYTATINGGAGNDKISLRSDAAKSLIEYKSGDGNDLIQGFSTISTLQIGNGGTSDTYSKATVGSDVFVSVGNGVITLSGAASLATLNIAGTEVVTEEGAYINNTVSGTLITATNYDDTIENYGSGVTINALGGHDSIYNEGETVSIVGGNGNDIIYNWSSNDTLTITGGTGEKSTAGNDVLVSVAGSGVITLVGAKGKTVNVYPTSGPAPTVAPAVSQQEVIKKFMKSLDTTTYSGVAALDQAVSVASGGYFKDIKTAVDKMVEDCSVTGNANDFLSNYCGIDLSNTDTGAITGADAGGSTVKTKNSIVPEEGSLNNFTENTFKANGLTVQLARVCW